MNVKSDKRWFELRCQHIDRTLKSFSKCDGSDNNDVVEVEKLQGEMGWLEPNKGG